MLLNGGSIKPFSKTKSADSVKGKPTKHRQENVHKQIFSDAETQENVKSPMKTNNNLSIGKTTPAR